MSFLPGMFPAAAAAAAAAAVTTLTQQASATSTDLAQITCPADIIADDVLLLFDTGYNIGTPPASAVPTGFTSIGTASLGGSNNTRGTLSYKIADGTEGGTTLTGMTFDSNSVKLLYTFRPNGVVSTVTPGDVEPTATNSNPAAHTVSASAGAPPLIVVGGYSSSGAIDPRTFSTTKDGEITASASALTSYLAYKIYNASPADTSIDMDDEGADNILVTCYLAAA